LVGKSEEKGPLGRPRLTWEDNIKMDLGNRVGVCELDSLAQDRDRWWAVVNTVMNLQFT
jgi:hypothetical protein